MKRVSFGELIYAGLYILLLLFLANAYPLSVYELGRLLVLGGLLLLLLRGAGRWRGLLTAVLPLVVVFCAVQFDPRSGDISRTGEAWIPGFYRLALPLLSFVLAVFAVLGRIDGRSSQDAFNTLDKWALGLGAAAAVFYCAVSLAFAAGRVEWGRILVTGLLFLSYLIIYVVARRTLLGPRRERTFVLALAVLFSAAALVGVVRVSMMAYLYDDAVQLIDKGDHNGGKALLHLAGRLNDTLAIRPVDTGIHYNLGRCYLMEGDGLEAFREAEKALAVDPRHAPSLVLSGNYYISQRDWGRAAEAFEGARRLDRKDASYYPSLALAYARLHHFEKGQSLAGYPGGLTSGISGWANRLVLADALSRWGRYKEARDLAESLVRTNPSNYIMITELGIALEGLGMAVEAEENYNEAIRVAPKDSFVAYARLAGIYARSGRAEESKVLMYAARDIETRYAGLDDFSVNQQAKADKGALTFYPGGEAFRDVRLTKGGHVMRLAARADTPLGDGLRLAVKMDGKELGGITVGPGSWSFYELPFMVDASDIYRVELGPARAYATDWDKPVLYVKETVFARTGHE